MTFLDLTPQGIQKKRKRKAFSIFSIMLIAFLSLILMLFTIANTRPVEPYQPYITIKSIKAAERDKVWAQVTFCESQSGTLMSGDNGKSWGWVHFQKPTLEEVMNTFYKNELTGNYSKITLTNAQWKGITENAEEARFWFEYAWYDLDLSDKWWNTKNKMKKGLCG